MTKKFSSVEQISKNCFIVQNEEFSVLQQIFKKSQQYLYFLISSWLPFATASILPKSLNQIPTAFAISAQPISCRYGSSRGLGKCPNEKNADAAG